MKAPFFLLGFLSMLIAVSAFARIQEEQVPYEQIVANMDVGMELTFAKDFYLEHNGSGVASKTIWNLDQTERCWVEIESNTPVRLQTVRTWKIARAGTDRYNKRLFELEALVDGRTRTLKLGCSSQRVDVGLLRENGIDVPRLKPVRVDVIRDEGGDYQHVRDENATIAI